MKILFDDSVRVKMTDVSVDEDLVFVTNVLVYCNIEYALTQDQHGTMHVHTTELSLDEPHGLDHDVDAEAIDCITYNGCVDFSTLVNFLERS